MSFGGGAQPYKPPSTPVAANAAVREAGNRQMSNNIGYRSFVSTSSVGLKRKEGTQKTSIVGGS